MDAKELSQLRRMKRELEKDRQHLEELEWDASAPPSLRQYCRISDEKSPGELAREITDLKTAITEKQLRCIREEKRLWLFISETDDSYWRLMLILRFVYGMPWEAVANEMHCTADAVRKSFCRKFKPP
ncbi:MAG: hypothetical protein LUI13_01660 [Lachnospiraceae bacterium]|nr:hypothetical protein [Lachnospiraceae bacterium]